MSKSLLKINQFGETIVEVLIALVVIGSALAGAYAISNRSNITTQANYERYQAQVLANDQAEFLDKAVKNNPSGRVIYDAASLNDPAINSTALKCFNDNGEAISGDVCKSRSYGNLYSINIQCLNGTEANCSSSSGYRVYRIYVEWDSLKGGKDNVELYYGV